VEPSGEISTIGFWKHQVLAILDGKGHNQIPVADMGVYLDMIQSSTILFDLDSDGEFTFEEAKAVLVLKKGTNMRDRAQQQLLAVYFNLAHRAVNADTQIDVLQSGNNAVRNLTELNTVGEAVQFTEDIIANELSDRYDYELVKELCEDINTARIVVFN